MPLSTIRAEGPFPGDEYSGPSWTLLIDEKRATSTTLAIDHASEPLSVDHHCAPNIDCSFKRLVAVRQLGDAIVWLCPPSARAANEFEPQALDEVVHAPLWFSRAGYAAWLASMRLDPAAEMAHIAALSRREADEILWMAGMRALELDASWPTDEVWTPPWGELVRARRWYGVEPEGHPLGARLLDLALREEPSFELVEVVASLPEGACRLVEVVGDEGQWSGSRLAAAPGAGGPSLLHAVGRGVWARFSP